MYLSQIGLRHTLSEIRVEVVHLSMETKAHKDGKRLYVREESFDGVIE